MKASWLLNAALFALVAALAGFVYFKPRSDEPVRHVLSTMRAEQVTQIRIEREGDPPIELRKEGTRWLVTSPVKAQADPFQIQRLLALLGASSARRLAATDLARFDLDPPQVRVSIDGESFGFGAVNSLTREQYVLVRDAVYPVEPRYGALLPANANELIKKQLLAAEELPSRFSLPGFTVALSEGKWQVTPDAAELSQDELIGWVEAWRYASALRVEPYSGRQPPLDRVQIDLRDGRALTLEVAQRTPDFVIARPDEKLQYHLAAEAARRLFAPPGSRVQAKDAAQNP